MPLCRERIMNNSQKNFEFSKAEKKINDRKHQCEVCEKVYKSKYILEYHIDHVHKNTNQQKCDVCSKTFTSLAHLSNHMKILHAGKKSTQKTNTTDKIYQCEVCNKWFGRNETLQTHIKQ